MKLRLVYHLAFWSSLTVLFLLQNPEAERQDYLAWCTILLTCSIVVYVNLYILFPRYFFRKKYFNYSLMLFVTVGVGALVLTWLLPINKYSIGFSFFQHFINLVSFVALTSSLKFFREYSRKQKSLIKAENERLKAELTLLKSQVNHHFLFNTLNNIYGLISQSKNEKAAEAILKLSDLMRYLLKGSNSEKISLKEEITFIEHYLSLEKIRLNANADIIFEASGVDHEIFIEPLLFIPLVENVFKHGLQTISDVSFAHFSLSVQNNELFFEACNSLGYRPTNKELYNGTGLDNLRRRLSIIYPQRHELDIEETEYFFKATLYLQL